MSEKPARGRYLQALQARWIYVVIAVGLSVTAATIATLLASPRYEAGADVLIDPVPTGTLVGLPVFHDQGSGSSVVTAARLASSPQVAARARATLGLKNAPPVTITPQQQSSIVTITGSSSSADEAARIANAFAQALVADRSALYQQALLRITGGLSRRLSAANGAEAVAIANQLAAFRALSNQTDPTLAIVSPAVPPTSKSSPRPLLNLAIAVIIGLLLGVGIALGIEMVSPRVLRADTLLEEGGLPLLARMPRPTSDAVRAALVDPHELPVDTRSSMRALWGKVGSPDSRREEALTILVAGAGAEHNGAPAVAAVLAAIISRAGTSVALIDADLERGPLAAMIDSDLASTISLGKLLRSDHERAIGTSEAARGRAQPDHLRALLVEPQDRVGEWLSPYRLASLVAQMKSQIDTIVISAPPPPAAELTTLADHADAIIVVIELGVTSRDGLAQLLQSLAERNVTPAGFVALDQPSLRARIADAPSTLRPAQQRRWA
jgi:capsular polysaccharide biosynthesis protein